MKRLVSVLVAVFFMTGMVVAQNTSTTTQTGDGNNATVDQQGSDHESIIEQQAHSSGDLDDGNTVVVNQNSGINNFSDVLQGNAPALNAETYVDQVGSNNDFSIKQAGGSNWADIDQEGNGNIIGNYKNYSGRAVQINGNVIGQADKNFLEVDQLGDNNKLGVWQDHYADAKIEQNGNLNETNVKQTSAKYGELNEADVEINGNENITEVYQEGDGNDANMQVGHPSYVSSENNITITQDGNNNKATYSHQLGDENEVVIDQFGNSNESEITLENGSENVVSYDVDGTGNYADFYIDADWTDHSNENNLNIIQEGNSNLAVGKIHGDLNDVDIEQDGNNNMVGSDWWYSDGVNIMGSNNTVDIQQMNNGNSSLNSINGNGNTITVTQQ